MDCSADETETISGDDANVPNWPYLFEAVTRGNSPVRDSVVTCNNRIFPLATDDSKRQFSHLGNIYNRYPDRCAFCYKSTTGPNFFFFSVKRVLF